MSTLILLRLVGRKYAHTDQNVLFHTCSRTVRGDVRYPCAVCDRVAPVHEHHVLTPQQLPHRAKLRASSCLQRHARVMEEFSSYPNDHEHLLDGLVLSVHGFEEAEPRRMHVCDECFRSLKVDRIPEAALANGFWVGKLPAKFDSATKVERAAAYPVRVKGHVIALETRRMRNIPGSAQRSLRGTSVFYANDSCSVAKQLPLAAAGLLDMFTVVLVGNHKPTTSQLRRLLGARKGMVRDLVDYVVDKNNHLVGGFQHARQASVSQENIDTYPDELEVPSVLMKAVSASEDSDNIRQNAKSTYTNDRRDDDTSSSDNDGNTAAEDEVDMIDKLVCLACLTTIDGDGDNVLKSAMYSFLCPSCSAWVKRLPSGRSDPCACCEATITDTEPIIRVTIDDPRGNGRRIYKVSHADGASCCPAVYTPSKPVPCHMCSVKKGDRLDLSGGDKDPAKAMCRPCFANFRVTFAKTAIEQAAAPGCASAASGSDFYSPKRNRSN